MFERGNSMCCHHPVLSHGRDGGLKVMMEHTWDGVKETQEYSEQKQCPSSALPITNPTRTGLDQTW
jgi:hypothetical protein